MPSAGTAETAAPRAAGVGRRQGQQRVSTVAIQMSAARAHTKSCAGQPNVPNAAASTSRPSQRIAMTQQIHGHSIFLAH